MTQYKDSAIQQINLGYHEQEDRLLLRLGLADQTEVVVWLTRRICQSLWSLLRQTQQTTFNTAAPTATPAMPVADKPQAMQEFAREVAEQQAINHMDFQSEYVSNRVSRTEAPLLVVQCAIISMNNQLPQLEMQCANGPAIKMALNNEIIHAFIGSLQITTKDTQWALESSSGEPAALNATAASQKLLH